MEAIILLQDYKKKFYMEPRRNVQNIWKTVLLNSSSGVAYKLTPGLENGTIIIKIYHAISGRKSMEIDWLMKSLFSCQELERWREPSEH